jgi:uncharacterized damage-inducible protein DinB
MAAMEERDKGRLIANLKSLPNELEDLVEGLSDEELRWRPIPNKWSIAEILAHLRDVEREAFQVRLRRTIGEDTPTFELWDQDSAAADRDYLAQSGRAALAEFKALRAETVASLESVPVEKWERVGVHPERGPATLEEQVTRQVKNHDLTHMIQIKDILRIKMPW